MSMVMHPFNMKAVATRWVVLVFFLVLGVPNLGKAQETTCARVQIQILQELTLERQAFDATMKINNTTDAGVIENVSAVVKVSDELGTPVPISSNPNDLSAKFFVKVSSKVAINDVDGGGTVNPQTTAVIDWLLIPAPGSAGTSPLGKKYLVGATLKYRFNGQDTTLDVSPDVITVKPLPLLTLDYFLPTDVYADDALTPEVEPVVPFTLGVRVRNNGFATAKNLKIDSAQPKIVENKQGLLIGFKLDGSYVDDAPVNDGLLLNFGDVAPSTNRMGRWVMETTLAGRFSDFTATFTHSDDLGGQLTSILQATNAHVLLQDVRVDLPGRDAVRDFLALDAGVVRVYESDGPDSLVNDRSGVAQLLSASSNGDIANYNLSFPPTDGFVFVKLGDPFSGSKVPGAVLRSDGKLLPGENVWLSKTRDPVSKVWSYYVNFFDVNSTGSYRAEFTPPPTGNLPPNLGLIADHTVAEGKQVSFLVEASSPAGKPVTITAAPLPAGARLLPQPADPQAPTLTRVAFDWTPAVGQAGTYLIVYTATDGTLSATRSAKITVVTNAPPGGPGAPSITAPLSGAQVPAVKPTLSALASTAAQDPTTQLQFELYADEAMNQLVASALQPKAPDAPGNGAGSVPQPTTWQVPSDLQDNTRYWWRVRAFDGTNYSLWANGRFFVNLFNDPPERFNLLLPVPGGEVADGQPVLNWANAVDKDGDVVTYGVRVYRDAALTDGAAGVEGLAADLSGASQWQVTPALTSRRLYYWNVTATDALGAKTVTAARSFIVGIGNMAPTAPGIASPVSGSLVPSLQVDLQTGHQRTRHRAGYPRRRRCHVANAHNEAARRSHRFGSQRIGRRHVPVVEAARRQSWRDLPLARPREVRRQALDASRAIGQRRVAIYAHTVGHHVAVLVDRIGPVQHRLSIGHLAARHRQQQVEALRRVVEQVDEEAAVGPQAVVRAVEGTHPPPVPGVVLKVAGHLPGRGLGHAAGTVARRIGGLGLQRAGHQLVHRLIGIQLELQLGRRVLRRGGSQGRQRGLHRRHLRARQRRRDAGRARPAWWRVGHHRDLGAARRTQRAIRSRVDDQIRARLPHRWRPVEGHPRERRCLRVCRLRQQSGARRQRGRGDRHRLAGRAARLDEEAHLLALGHRVVRDQAQVGRQVAGGRRRELGAVAAGAVHVEEVDVVGPDLADRVARFAEPHVLAGQQLAVRAQYRARHLAAAEGVAELDEDEAIGRREAQVVVRDVAIAAGAQQLGHAAAVVDEAVRAVGFVDPHHTRVQGQEVAHRVPPRQVHPHVLQQHMGVCGLQDGGQLPAQVVRVRERGGEVAEPAGQRGFHHPAAHAVGAGRDVAKVEQQPVVHRRVVDITAIQLEADQQPLLVLDDLGLGRIDLEIFGRREPVVAHAHAQRERHHRLDLGCQRVVGIDVGGQKVVQRQQRQRLDGDDVGRHVQRRVLAVEAVFQRGADEVFLAQRAGAGRAGRGD